MIYCTFYVGGSTEVNNTIDFFMGVGESLYEAAPVVEFDISTYDDEVSNSAATRSGEMGYSIFMKWPMMVLLMLSMNML